MNLTWTHWTQKVPVETSNPDEKDASANAKGSPKYEWELRPTWQRASVCAIELGLAAFGVVMTLGPRTRVVRSLFILPPTPVSPNGRREPKRIFVQCAHHKRDQGHIFPMSASAIPDTARTEDVLLYIQGVRGGLMVGLDSARINGEEKSKANIRSELYKQWWGLAKPIKWTSGPLATGRASRA
jgi:hypothetical protein